MKHLASFEEKVQRGEGPFVELDVDEPVITTAIGVSTGDYTANDQVLHSCAC